MTFQIILTCLIGAGILITLDQIGTTPEQKEVTKFNAILKSIINGIIIYGIWNWIK